MDRKRDLSSTAYYNTLPYLLFGKESSLDLL